MLNVYILLGVRGAERVLLLRKVKCVREIAEF